jgi:predicted Fe-Mo cluster-binding NifX family protein
VKVCFPVYKNEGINSTVYGHFGSAPEFVFVNSELLSVTTVGNKDLDHNHGACNPVMAMGGHSIDAVVVGGIGAGALRLLNAEGIKVYKSVKETIKENLVLLKEGRLPELTFHHACSGHQGGCAHL